MKGFLSRKVGPLPMWTWLALGTIVSWYVWKRMRSGSAAAATTDLVPTAGTPGSMGQVPSAGAPADNGAATADLLSAYGQQQSDLIAALGQQVSALSAASSTLASSAAQMSSFAGAQGQGAAALDTSTAATTSPQPGGSNAPTFQFVFPNITGSTTATKPAVKGSPKPAAKSKPKPVAPSTAPKYETFQKNVKLKRGQKVHFRAGKGFYAA